MANNSSSLCQVVNALLTGLDRLKRLKNVLVMTTSNIAGAIGALRYLVIEKGGANRAPDPAFVDRADIVEYVDYPPPEAVYMILSGCVEEMARKGLVEQPYNLKSWSSLSLRTSAPIELDDSAKLQRLAELCHVS